MPLVTGPDGKTHHDHGVHVLGNAALLRRALSISARRLDDQAIAVRLTAAWVGHAVPTGDMFRRIQIHAWTVDALGNTLESAPPVTLARLFDDIPRDSSGHGFMTQRVQVADQRVQAPGTPGSDLEREVRFPHVLRGAAVRWEVLYQRMMDPLALSFGINPLEDQLKLAEGELPLASTSDSASPPGLVTPSVTRASAP